MVPMLNCLPNRLIDECIASAPTNDHVFNAPGGVKSVKDTMFNNMRCFLVVSLCLLSFKPTKLIQFV